MTGKTAEEIIVGIYENHTMSKENFVEALRSYGRLQIAEYKEQMDAPISKKELEIIDAIVNRVLRGLLLIQKYPNNYKTIEHTYADADTLKDQVGTLLAKVA